jgi:hypothetical protein
MMSLRNLKRLMDPRVKPVVTAERGEAFIG